MSATTIVHTAEGKAIHFAGATAKLIVAHPRLAAAVAFVIGNLAGVLLHV
jgi:ElaB/YqjD/DUF883 family membrane-anchored ribosome-binding protein